RHQRNSPQPHEPTPTPHLPNRPTISVSSEPPHQPRIRRIIFRVDWSGGPKRDKITSSLVRIRAAILNIDIHFNDKVVFLLRRFLEEKLLSNFNLLGRGALELNRRIRLRRRSELGKRRRRRLLNDRTDRRTLR